MVEKLLNDRIVILKTSLVYEKIVTKGKNIRGSHGAEKVFVTLKFVSELSL